MVMTLSDLRRVTLSNMLLELHFSVVPAGRPELGGAGGKQAVEITDRVTICC